MLNTSAAPRRHCNALCSEGCQGGPKVGDELPARFGRRRRVCRRLCRLCGSLCRRASTGARAAWRVP